MEQDEAKHTYRMAGRIIYFLWRTNMEIIEQIQRKSIEERIYIIEQILLSVKRDMTFSQQIPQKSRKPFHVRKFHLGQEVQVDRDLIHSDRFM